MGITDLKKKYNIEDMIKGDTIFCATGVTNGEMVNGIIDKGDYFEASSFVLHKSQKISNESRRLQLAQKVSLSGENQGRIAGCPSDPGERGRWVEPDCVL